MDLTKTFVFVAILVGLSLAAPNLNQGLWINPEAELDVSPRKIVEGVEVPANFTWQDKDGINYLTLVKNQHIPQYCGSCWAFAATSVLSDRIKIQRNAMGPDLHMSPQVLLSCAKENRGCSGGWHLLAYKYIKDNGITDETCSAYLARGHKNGADCEAQYLCKNCDKYGNCWPMEEYPKYYVEDYGFVSGEKDMMEEIYNWGPISCTIAVTEEVHAYTGGVFRDTTGRKERDHVVEITGFGEENGVKYWEIRNSWGTYWGDEGFMKLVRGIDNLGIETNCSWANVKNSWDAGKEIIHRISDQDRTQLQKDKLYQSVKYQLTRKDREAEMYETKCRLDSREYTGGEKILTPRPHEYLNLEDLPENLDWRNVSGVSYASTWVTNQHVPQYCGSCFLQATTASLADRFNILLKRTNINFAFSVQSLMNCAFGGKCATGGHPIEVYQYADTDGILHNSCMNYESKDIEEDGLCDPINVCRDCQGPPPPDGEQSLENCWAVDNPRKYYASEYGQVQGVDKMKAEIFARGPISCGIKTTPNLYNYTGGVYSEVREITDLTHEISVLGWGKTTEGEEYWIARNSWGTYWGEGGFFKISMYENNLGITRDCCFGVPDVERSGFKTVTTEES
ncbi:unnamed protein product [Moneuplotes crassus]|uniref:Peptidase C1A papain C-terminal domain-containing protein n=1 Tax=Euplotes crassus TaxID=5936 RepID=A0AAD1U7H8_EUPCR|nr:unnamed protein product [Moneuplotes crassus]